MSYYDWKSEYDTFTRVASEQGSEKAGKLLDLASASAKAGNLREAARILEELRGAVVGAGLFASWDNGIWCFTSLITFIREMSPETNVPGAYQRFLDAIPSAKYDEAMTATQKEFWYGPPKTRVRQGVHIEPSTPQPGKSGCAAVFLIGIALVIYFAVK